MLVDQVLRTGRHWWSAHTHRILPVGSCRLPQRCGIDGHLPQPLASGRKNCIGYCRNDGRSPALAHSTRWLGSLNNMNLDRGRLVHAKHLVAVEVGLLDTAVLERDLTMKCGRDAEDNRTLNLRPYGIGVDHGATVHCADDAPDTNRAILRYFNFGNLRHVGPEDELKGDAAAGPLRQRLSPASLFGGKLEDSLAAGGLVEEGQPVRDRILLCRRREFVHEAFGHKDIVRRPDAAPEAGRNAWRFDS